MDDGVNILHHPADVRDVTEVAPDYFEFQVSRVSVIATVAYRPHNHPAQLPADWGWEPMQEALQAPSLWCVKETHGVSHEKQIPNHPFPDKAETSSNKHLHDSPRNPN
jgi:hypothetical protein